ncbi:hypothetical protein P3T36_006488 [Kitasatospora sp. MAP12-15]|uniref:DUF5990 family protein n=1 Tax=unclassified Kitasatospora TaxID=2633591 RepID=UPI00247358A9|nr:DUF5990 family protein [Kitasatospora sp. MAP12-44]MDH6114978.1 hypothetical protein [Kitasatospora sp. MAP12-44]
MQIRIEASDLPGRSCAGGPDFPGYDNIHVAVQRREKPAELLGLQPGDAASASWTLDCTVLPSPSGVDLRGPYVQGRPGGRFIYLSWGTVDADGGFRMFRRAKLLLNAIDPAVLTAALRTGVLVAALGLTDGKGHPLCASIRPPLVRWSAEAPAQ